MDPTVDLFGQSQFRPAVPSFRERILNDEPLRDRDDLENCSLGCEIIAALDGRDFLAA